MSARTSLLSGGKTKLPATGGALRGWSGLFFLSSSLLDTSLFLISTWAGLGRGKAVHPFIFLVFMIDDWPACTLRFLSLSYVHLQVINSEEQGSKGEENGITWAFQRHMTARRTEGFRPRVCRPSAEQP